MGREKPQAGEAARGIENDEFRSDIPTITPTVIEGVWGRGGIIGGKAELFEHRAVIPQIAECALHIAHRQTRGRQHLTINWRVLVDNIPLALPAQAGDERNIDGIAAAFVIHIRKQGGQVVRFGI